MVNTVLDREAFGRTGFTVSRLADEVGVERSKASRTTQDLCDKGFLERRDDETLRAGKAFCPGADGPWVTSAQSPSWRRPCR
ncbi:hypothetical protein [Streptomyces sp. NPDC005859]|uniref:hypothetical protein n=1 Tax=Streptomyces sp. NPDC005859 TaxID=3157170 RepID=UPI0033F9E6C9